jgi:hypothetical protein
MLQVAANSTALQRERYALQGEGRVCCSSERSTSPRAGSAVLSLHNGRFSFGVKNDGQSNANGGCSGVCRLPKSVGKK